MIRVCILIYGMFLLTSCNNNGKIPAGVLKPDKMQAVLWDVIKADAFTKDYIQKDSAKDALLENLKLQDQVFSIHKVTKEDFYSSYDFYKANPGLYKQIMDTIIARAGREKSEMNKPSTAE